MKMFCADCKFYGICNSYKFERMEIAELECEDFVPEDYDEEDEDEE